MARTREAVGSETAPGREVTVSTFSSRDMHVVVEKPEAGYMCSLSMCARVPLPPDELYAMLVDPSECLRIFKSLKRVVHRRVLADDGQGNRTVEVDQTGAWRFLCFRGHFTVRMIVEQSRQHRTVNFRLARSGFMRDFTGTWQIHPYDNSSLDRLVNKHSPSPLHRLQSGLRAVEASLGLAGQQQDSLVQLQQSIAPAFAPPKTLVRVLERIAAKQIQKIMGDLQEEARRINAAAAAAGGAGAAASGAASGSGGGSAAAPEAAAVGGKRRGKRRETAEDAPATPTTAAQQQQRQGKKHLLAHITPLD